MEATSLYENFEPNLMTIQRALKTNIPYRKTALPDALPLELLELADVLNQGGTSFSLKARDLSVVDEFVEQYRAQYQRVMDVLRKQLDDKRTTVWIEGVGSLLVKEKVIRALEYLNEAAALLDTMMVQRKIGNPRTLASYNEVAPSPNKTFRYPEK